MQEQRDARNSQEKLPRVGRKAQRREVDLELRRTPHQARTHPQTQQPSTHEIQELARVSRQAAPTTRSTPEAQHPQEGQDQALRVAPRQAHDRPGVHFLTIREHGRRRG